jgi:hypothetical protein
MPRDRWFVLGVIGAALSWVGQVDVILVPLLVAFIGLAVYRYRVACRRAR